MNPPHTAGFLGVSVRAARLGRVALAALAAACSGGKEKDEGSVAERLDAALGPRAIAAALQAAGGHYRARSVQRITDPKRPKDETALPDSVATTTDLWLDKRGNYRLVENNDRDGGREIIVHGREIGVALRYGKMIRRPAQEPEPTRYLDEALGAPLAAWEVVRHASAIEKTADGTLRLLRAGTPEAPPSAEMTPLQTWRATVDVTSLTGEARLDAKGALASFKLNARFGLRRGDTPLEGEITVDAQLVELGKTPAVGPPLADELRPRQRTILEERALLGPPKDAAKAGSRSGAGKPGATSPSPGGK